MIRRQVFLTVNCDAQGCNLVSGPIEIKPKEHGPAARDDFIVASIDGWEVLTLNEGKHRIVLCLPCYQAIFK